jgi:hypothetical protein
MHDACRKRESRGGIAQRIVSPTMLLLVPDKVVQCYVDVGRGIGENMQCAE